MLQKAFLFRLADGVQDQSGKEMVFGPQVDESFRRSNRPSGNRKRLDQRKRIVLQDVSVLESADFPLIRVADNEFFTRRMLSCQPPLQA